MIVRQRLICQKRVAAGDRIAERGDLFRVLMPCLLEASEVRYPIKPAGFAALRLGLIQFVTRSDT